MMIESKRERYIRLLSGLTDMGATLTANATVEVVELLKEPIADAAPVVHGRWTDKDGGIATCSVCGDRWGVWSVMKYCPNCGARMDGKDDDHEKAD